MRVWVVCLLECLEDGADHARHTRRTHPSLITYLFFFRFFSRNAAPKPVTRHLVVAARPAKPTKPDAAVFENPKREAYPEEVLTHRFRPYGDPGDPLPEDSVAVDKAEVSAKEERPKRKGDETGSSKKKKSKVVVS
jgi:hypothetical protein